MCGSGFSITNSPPPPPGGIGVPVPSRMPNAIGPSAFPLRSGRTGVVGKNPQAGPATSVCHHWLRTATRRRPTTS